ncbi:universal stress protein [Streptomyces sp. NBC_00503]|uniref:universal stress protein n=1 Tax=Streptomyces sp. NBC_00503 TaxID=2903659 RepID=UPI002E81BB61|nr:universal stress protein [Streptomyces sp. NBC_00503]WUD85695.1 universal stress protein [Streptomyces sp. NBC_00503]
MRNPQQPPLPVASTEIRSHWGENLLRETSAELRRLHPLLDITTRVVGGPPSEALAAAARSSTMLVIGSRGLGSIAGLVVGSVVSATMAATEHPVVVVRSSGNPVAPANGLRTRGAIVADVETRRPCDSLLAFAFEGAAHRRAALHVLHGWTPPPILSYAPALDPGVLQEMAHGITAALEELFRPWRDKFPSVEVEARAPIGQAAIQLVEAGFQAPLAVGRRIRSSAFGPHVGPITHALLHHSTAPVAVVAHD